MSGGERCGDGEQAAADGVGGGGGGVAGGSSLAPRAKPGNWHCNAKDFLNPSPSRCTHVLLESARVRGVVPSSSCCLFTSSIPWTLIISALNL